MLIDGQEVISMESIDLRAPNAQSVTAMTVSMITTQVGVSFLGVVVYATEILVGSVRKLIFAMVVLSMFAMIASDLYVTDAKECFAVGVMVIMRMRCLNARNVTQRIAIVAIALVVNVGYFPVRLVSCTIYRRGASSALSV
jgi:hypothetical protein